MLKRPASDGRGAIRKNERFCRIASWHQSIIHGAKPKSITAKAAWAIRSCWCTAYILAPAAKNSTTTFALSRDFRVYAIDLLGFGMSDAPQIRYRAKLYPLLLGDFIRDVIGEPAGVVTAGESGPFLAALAAEEPDLVSKLVFISPQHSRSTFGRAGWLWEMGRELVRMLLLFPPLHLLFQEVMAGEWEIGEMLRRSFREKRVIAQGQVVRLSELARMPGVLDAYASLQVGLLSMPFDPTLARIAAQTLFICGTCVAPETAEDVEYLCRLAPNGRLEWVEHAAEWVHYEMASRANRLIASFLGNAQACDVGSDQEISGRSVLAVA